MTKKISGLTDAGTLDGTETVEITKAGATKNTTTAHIAALGVVPLHLLFRYSTEDSVPDVTIVGTSDSTFNLATDAPATSGAVSLVITTNTVAANFHYTFFDVAWDDDAATIQASIEAALAANNMPDRVVAVSGGPLSVGDVAIAVAGDWSDASVDDSTLDVTPAFNLSVKGTDTLVFFALDSIPDGTFLNEAYAVPVEYYALKDAPANLQLSFLVDIDDVFYYATMFINENTGDSLSANPSGVTFLGTFAPAYHLVPTGVPLYLGLVPDGQGSGAFDIYGSFVTTPQPG